MGCPAKPLIEKKFLFFRWKEQQPHDYSFLLSHSSWWKIHWYCKTCNASHDEWPVNDYELMRRFDLKHCPPHFSMSISEEDLEAYKIFPVEEG